jgi:hypothetical protein
MCLVGDLSATATTPALPVMCSVNLACRNTVAGATITGSCPLTCIPSATTSCFSSDYGNKLGPLCYVGTFGLTAEIGGCGLNQFCVNCEDANGVIKGQCSQTDSCAAGTKVIGTTNDLANKLGPICFVGQFNDDSIAIACKIGQQCQRVTRYSDSGTTTTIGACVTTCTPDEMTFCCSDDLCNGYRSEVEMKNKKYQSSESVSYSSTYQNQQQPQYGQQQQYGQPQQQYGQPQQQYGQPQQQYVQYPQYQQPQQQQYQQKPLYY